MSRSGETWASEMAWSGKQKKSPEEVRRHCKEMWCPSGIPQFHGVLKERREGAGFEDCLRPTSDLETGLE